MKRKNWNKEEDDYLINNYKDSEKDELIRVLKRTWISIQSRASKLELKRSLINHINGNQKIWNEDEINFLKLNYKKLEKELIVKNLQRSWGSIQQKAALLKLKRAKVEYCNQKKLISGSNESFYWMGFLFADGHFNERVKQIQINLSKKDFNHLKKFSLFMECKKEINKASLYIGISEIWEFLCKKFKINHNKTYIPCELNNLTTEQLIPLFIGFIDGDGSINKKGYINIKVHKNWEENIKKMMKCFLEKFNKTYKIYHNKNLIEAYITDIEVTKYIKKTAIKLNLPILNRKWDNISFDKMSMKENKKRIFLICKRCFNDKMSVKEASAITNLSQSVIYKNYRILNGNKLLRKL